MLQKVSFLIILFSFYLALAGCNANVLKPPAQSGGGERPPTESGVAFIRESVTLKQDVKQRVVIDQSNVVLDCAGHALNRGIEIRSRRLPTKWKQTRNVIVKNCKMNSGVSINALKGPVHVNEVVASSRMPRHIQAMQAIAPTDIRLENLTFNIDGQTSIFAHIGVTRLSVINSLFSGTTGSGPVIYLAPESAYHQVSGNTFDVETNGREQIAIDGSANNRITDNRFVRLKNGGIYLYRNCGERGMIRHLTPSHNVIKGNTFHHDKFWPNDPAVWVASRNGNRHYCHLDKGYAFGSSVSDLDHATHNVIEGNYFINKEIIRIDSQPNTVRGNTTKSAS